MWDMRRAGTGAAAVAALLAFTPAAGAVGVAYIDNGNVQVSSVDGATKASVTSDGTVGEGTARRFSDVAHAASGKVFAAIDACVTTPCTLSVAQYSPLGAKVSEYFPNWNQSRPPPTWPLGFDVNPTGTNVAFGWQTQSCTPTCTYQEGTWVAPGDHSAGTPFELYSHYHPSFWGDRVVGVGSADNKVLIQDAAGAPYQNNVTEWLTWGDLSWFHFIRAAVAPNGTTFAFTAYDAEPEPDGPPFLWLGANTGGPVPDGTPQFCDFPTGPNPSDVSFSPDSTLMAWRDDQGIKVVAVPPVPAQNPGDPLPACAPGTPTVISATGTDPALGGIDVPALIAARGSGTTGTGTGTTGTTGTTGGTTGGPGTTGTTGTDTTPPAFTIAPKFRPAAFRALAAGATIAATAGGSKLSFSLSEAATLKLTITGGAAGKRVRGGCVKPTRTNRRASSCLRTVTLGSVSKSVAEGSNSLKFSGRVDRKALKPGAYTASLLATDAATNRSKPANAKFKIVKR